MSPIRVEAALRRVPANRGEPCPVDVAVVNEDDGPVTVCARLAPGYEDSSSREVFAEVLDADTGAPAPVADLDYTRDPAEPPDFVRLGPSERVAGSFDLFEWYRPQRPGRYRVTVRYQADELGAHAPADVVHGVFSSEPFELEVS